VTADDDVLRSVDALLRHAAAADTERAQDLLSRLTPARLLDLVVTQAELAVDEERPRTAGIDVVAELGRAAIEVMGLPQDAGLDLEDDDPYAPPAVTGWELATVRPDELDAACLTLPTRPWHLVLVAFADVTGGRTPTLRRVVAAAADGRLVTARLRIRGPLDGDADVLRAAVSADPADLDADGALAQGLHAALAAASRGVA
jgi:hypothetical protein